MSRISNSSRFISSAGHGLEVEKTVLDQMQYLTFKGAVSGTSSISL